MERESASDNRVGSASAVDSGALHTSQFRVDAMSRCPVRKGQPAAAAHLARDCQSLLRPTLAGRYKLTLAL